MQTMAQQNAAYYAASHGSAAAALAFIEALPGYQDALTRAVCQELETLRHREWVAANEARAEVRDAA